jgi:23S rRNA (cytidine1920-2'-O)/16S rRNA (cytidine1409-2'-O)-methyltransferase
MRKRLDQVLVERGLAASRSRARDAISRGLVRVDGAVAAKPGALVECQASLHIDPEAGTRYVSRGALKLAAALDAFGFDPKGRIALDAGASTGGFTQVLLARAALKVYAVDVGHGQLHEQLRVDPRAVSLEKCDVRKLSREIVTEPISAIVADVSFISLAKALPAALGLAVPGAWLVALIKPQFEAGPANVGKGGIVRDEAVQEKVVQDVKAWFEAQPGWVVKGVIPSPIEGGSGNREFLLGASFNG